MHLKIFYLTILIITSCGNLPNIKNDINKVQLQVPNSWKNINSNKINKIKIPENWWTLFGDEKLNAIVEKSLSDNANIKIALLNIQKSLLRRDISINSMIPNFNASGAYNKTYDKNNNIYYLNNLPIIQNPNNYIISNYSSSLNVAYQIDLFGKLLNQFKSSNLILKATAEDAYNAGLNITAKTISKYWLLASLNEKIKLYQELVKTAEKIYKTSQVKFKAGAISHMDYLNAENFLNNQKSSLENIKSRKEEAYTDLTIFMSLPPYAKLNIPDKMPNINLPKLPTEYPILVLSNRPDVRAAQLKLESSLNNIKIAIKSFYPDIIFNAGLSSSSKKIKNLMENPIKTLVFNFSLPVLQWPTNYTNFKLSKVNYNEDLINFKYTILNALKEVEIVFYNFKISENNYKLSKKLYLNDKKIEKAVKIRYEVGTDSFDDYLNAKYKTIKSKINELDNRLNMYNAYLLKILALGGTTRPIYKETQLKEKYYNIN